MDKSDRVKIIQELPKIMPKLRIKFPWKNKQKKGKEEPRAATAASHGPAHLAWLRRAAAGIHTGHGSKIRWLWIIVSSPTPAQNSDLAEDRVLTSVLRF